MKLLITAALLGISVTFTGTGTVHAAPGTAVSVQHFGQLADGTPVDLYTLKSKTLEVSITNYGGRIVTLKTPDRDGKQDDVALGYDSFEPYRLIKTFFGALVGRYANRIGHGQFTLNGRVYQLPLNAGANSLHGGLIGFDKRLWQAHAEPDGLKLTYVSRDGEEGYPGTLTATVRYTVIRNELRIEYRATTDRDTVVNLTNHAYFNLTGIGNDTVLGHQVVLHADRYTPTDAGQIPTGELRDVTGTPFDFRQPHAIGERIEAADEQLRLSRGYDHNWVLNSHSRQPALAAEVYEPKSGRVMQVLTTEPGLQFYTGNNLDGSIVGKGGIHYISRSGFCMETQHFPDSPNHPDFPSTTLKAGHTFHSTTIFRFSSRG
jgi:aldose 1-epimerase